MTTQDVHQIDLNLVELNGGTQSLARYDEETIIEYTSAWNRGDVFPPIEVYFDGERYWLSDGFRRVVSRRRADIPGDTIAAIVHQGTRRDAVLASVGADATDGLRRSNVDKRRAVMTLLQDSEWSIWSNAAIAKACGINESLVRTIKEELSSVKTKIDDQVLAKKCGVDVATVLEAKNQVQSLSKKRTAKRNGKPYSVDTSLIGSLTDKQTAITPPTTQRGVLEKPKTGWDISPQNLTTTVKRHKINVYFEELGDGCFFEFCGPAGSISESGFYSQLVSDRTQCRREYLNPGVWADFRAESLYSDYQQSLIESNQASEQLPIKFSSSS